MLLPRLSWKYLRIVPKNALPIENYQLVSLNELFFKHSIQSTFLLIVSYKSALYTTNTDGNFVDSLLSKADQFLCFSHQR